MTWRVARYVASPTRMPFVGAADWRRAAVLTTSPETSASPAAGSASSDTSTSPVFTAVRMRNRSAEDRHHGVADELLHRAAPLFDLLAKPRVVRSQECAHVLRVELLGTACEADEV